MPVGPKISEAYRRSYQFTKVSGQYRSARNMFAKVGGGYHPAYTFGWAVGGWGGCNQACGSGVQYRSVTCQRSDFYGNVNVAEAYCSGIGKPATQQSCNTHPCVYPDWNICWHDKWVSHPWMTTWGWCGLIPRYMHMVVQEAGYYHTYITLNGTSMGGGKASFWCGNKCPHAMSFAINQARPVKSNGDEGDPYAVRIAPPGHALTWGSQVFGHDTKTQIYLGVMYWSNYSGFQVGICTKSNTDTSTGCVRFQDSLTLGVSLGARA